MDSRRGSRGLVRSIASNWMTFLFSGGINFVVSPIIVRSLGETQYGAWALLISMVGYLGLLDLGVRSAVTRYIAKFHAGGDHERANRLYSAALRIFAVAGTVAVVLSFGMAALLGHVFNIPPELIGTARVVTVISGVTVAIALVSGVFGGVVIGLERFDYYNAIEIIISAVRALTIVTVLKTGNGLIALALVQLGAGLARGLANVWFSWKLYPQLHLSPRGWDRESAKLIFQFGLAASLLHVMGSLMLYSDSLVIGAFLPIGMITYFSIASGLSEYARSIVSGVSTTLTPRISALQAGGQQSDLQVALLTTARVSSLVVLPIVVTFVLRGASFIGLWMGPQYAELSGQILIVLSATLATLSGYQIVTAAMLGMGRQSGLIPVFIVEAVTNLVLSVIWVRAFGVIGTAMATMIPRVIISTLVGPWYVKRHLAMSLRKFWLHAFIQPALAMVPFAIATYTIERFWPARNLAVFFLQVFAVLPIMLITSWYVCLSRSERTAVAGLLARPVRRADPVPDL